MEAIYLFSAACIQYIHLPKASSVLHGLSSSIELLSAIKRFGGISLESFHASSI